MRLLTILTVVLLTTFSSRAAAVEPATGEICVLALRLGYGEFVSPGAAPRSDAYVVSIDESPGQKIDTGHGGFFGELSLKETHLITIKTKHGKPFASFRFTLDAPTQRLTLVYESGYGNWRLRPTRAKSCPWPKVDDKTSTPVTRESSSPK